MAGSEPFENTCKARRHKPPDGNTGAMKLKLYVTGRSEKLSGEIDRIAAYFRSRFGDASISVINVLDSPTSAVQDRVFVTPTLIRAFPGPCRRVMGNLSDCSALADALELEAP